MIRTNTPLGLVLLAVTLALFIGVFFLTPTAVAHDVDKKSDDDDVGTWFIGNGPPAGSGGKTGGGEGQGDDGDADPDWFQNSGWNAASMKEKTASIRDEVPRRMVLPVIGPYGQLVNWLLDLISNKYFGTWR